MIQLLPWLLRCLGVVDLAAEKASSEASGDEVLHVV